MGYDMADLRIIGGCVADTKGLSRKDIYIDDGIIKMLCSPGEGFPAKETIDATGMYVLPGIIDAHLHPVYADRIDTLSVAAAFGGITTLIPFIGAIKAWGEGGSIYDAVENFISEAERDSILDFSVHCTICHDDMNNINEVIPKLIKKGVISFKAFMCYSKRRMQLSDKEIMQVMELLKDSGGHFAVHAESGAMLDYLENAYIAMNQTSPEKYFLSHPNISEAEAVFRVLSLAKIINCPLYLPHLSATESLEVIRLFRKWDLPNVYTETCVHYLTLTEEATQGLGSLAKVGPPLRKQRDCNSLWEAVINGEIDVVATDTAGHLKEKKEPFFEDIFKSPSGLPGIGTLLTVMYQEGVNRGRITMGRLVEVLCENPAKIFGLYPRKGVLQPGSDADVVIFDPFKSHTIKAEDQKTKADYCMWEGLECMGKPITTIQRGKVLIDKGKVKATKGQGLYLAAGKVAYK